MDTIMDSDSNFSVSTLYSLFSRINDEISLTEDEDPYIIENPVNNDLNVYLTISGILVNADAKGYDSKRIRRNRASYARHLRKTYNESIQIHWRDTFPKDSKNINWGKLKDAQDLFLGKSEWVWVLDSDAFIMPKAKFSIIDVIKNAEKKNPNVNLIYAEDCNGINAGSFLLRTGNVEWMSAFLKEWLRHEFDDKIWAKDVWAEQAVLMSMIRFNTMDAREKYAQVVPMDFINAYAGAYCGREYHTGDLVVHAPGLGYKHLVDYLSEKGYREI